MRFECVEPFELWRMTFDGMVQSTTLRDQVAGSGPPSMGPHPLRDDGDVHLAFEFEIRSTLPPYLTGSLGGQGRPEGEDRFEQHAAVTGVVSVDGNETAFSGGAARVHRKGSDRTPVSKFPGHCWLTASFPSGRAFTFLNRYPSPEGGPLCFTEAWVKEPDGEMLVAEIIDRPWLQNSQVHDDKFSFFIRTSKGTRRVEGTSYASVFTRERPTGDATFPDCQQGVGRYRMDGEEGWGMIERTIPRWPDWPDLRSSARGGGA